MCDDFFDGWDDSFSDPDSDFEEDLMDEYADTEYAESTDKESINQESLESEENRLFDMAETVILGSMVVGNAIEESLDEKKRRKLLQSDDKSEE